MTPFRWEERSDATIVDLGGGHIANISPDAFVLLRSTTTAHIRSLIALFIDEFRDGLCRLMTMTPAQLDAWHPSDKYGVTTEGFGGANSCVGFKKNALRLAWLRQPSVVRAMIARGHLSEFTPSGKKRSISTKGQGPIADLALALPLTEQIALIMDAFAIADKIDEVVNLTQSSIFGLEDALVELSLLNSVDAILDWLVARTNKFRLSKTQHEPGVSKSRGDGRVFAAPWFLMWLARHELVLWPLAWEDSENLLPRLLKPLLWTLFTPTAGKGLSEALGRMESGVIHRLLLLTGNSFQFADFSDVHALHLKERYANQEGAPDRRQYDLTQTFRATLEFFKLSNEDAGPNAVFFGGYQDLATPDSRVAFRWVDDPKPARLRRYIEITGDHEGRGITPRIRQWAKRFRARLGDFGLKVSRKTTVNSLSLWLTYLSTLGEDCPGSWTDVTAAHIHHGPDCYWQFLLKHGGQNALPHLSRLEQMWRKCADAEGFVGTVSCPINLGLAIAPRGIRTPVRLHTSRFAMPEGLLPVLIDLNRANEFELARELGRFDRTVVDRHSGQKVTVFWPALPIMCDMLLHTGMRSHSIIWADSGEGDETVENDPSLGRRPNPSPTRTTGRRQGFLRLIDVGPRDVRLGWYCAVNKIQPHEVTYVDASLAQFVHTLRKWNERYNPIKRPIKASRDHIDISHAPDGVLEEVYPLFRDPKSPQRHPPTWGAFTKYFVDLTRAAEPIFNQRGRETDASWKDVTLVENGKLAFKLHSVRVTVATELADAGVDPAVTQMLLGHQSPMMTRYYDAGAKRRTSDDLEEAADLILKNTTRAVAEAIDRDASIDELDQLVGGMLNFRGTTASAWKQLERAKNGVPRVYSHGICASGTCATGGPEEDGKPTGVFRLTACSRCRYRLTGPAFLNGLVHNANSIVVEIKEGLEQEADLNKKRAEGDLPACSSRQFDDTIHQLQKLRDKLWLEWAAEVATIQQATRMFHSIVPPDHPDKGDLGSMSSVAVLKHDFALLDAVPSKDEIVAPSAVHVPELAARQMAKMTRKILQLNNIAEAFVRIPAELQDVATRRFGQLLVAHTKSLDADQRSVLEDIITGATKLADLPGLSDRVAKFIDRLSTPALAHEVEAE